MGCCQWPEEMGSKVRFWVAWKFKHQQFPEWSWRSFRRNWWRTSGEVWKQIFELHLLGKIVRSVFHQNSTANFTIKLHYEVLGLGWWRALQSVWNRHSNPLGTHFGTLSKRALRQAWPSIRHEFYPEFRPDVSNTSLAAWKSCPPKYHQKFSHQISQIS